MKEQIYLSSASANGADVPQVHPVVAIGNTSQNSPAVNLKREAFFLPHFFSLNGSKIHLWKDYWIFRGDGVNLNSMNIQKHVYSVPSAPRAPSSDNAGFISASEGDFGRKRTKECFPRRTKQEIHGRCERYRLQPSVQEVKTLLIFSIEKQICNNS